MVSAAVTLRVFRVPEKTPSSSLVKVPSVIAITCLLGLSRGDRPLRCLVRGDRIGRRYHRELLASGRSNAEDLEGGKICSTAAARRRARPPGKFFRRPGWGRRPRDPALERHAGTGLRKNPSEAAAWLMHGSSC